MRRELFKCFSAALSAGLCLIAIVALAQDGPQGNQRAQARVRPTAMPGEYLVVLKPGVRPEEIQKAAARLAPAGAPAKIVKTFDTINTIHIKVQGPASLNLQDFQRGLANNPLIEAIEPNYIYYPAEILPNDPRVKNGDAWHLKKVVADKAWDIRHDSPEVVVGIIDTGLFLEHQDLKGNLWVNPSDPAGDADGDGDPDDDHNGFTDDIHGADFVNKDGVPEAEPEEILLFGIFPTGRMEYQKHGSHVAGIIGAVGNNDIGTSGISWKVKIMGLKFFGGPDGGGSTDAAVSAIEYAIAKGAHIINASWGSTSESTALRRAIERANSAGILFVAAAGNGGPDGVGDDNDKTPPFFPASYDVPNVIAVAATGRDDKLTSFSNFGKTSVAIAAPGSEILSTVPGGEWLKWQNAPPPQQSYELMDGTSMAAPVVTGVAALVRAGNTSLSPQEVKTLLVRTVDDVSDLKDKVASNGRLNASKAVNPPIEPLVFARPENVSQDRVQELRQFLDALSPEIRTKAFLQQAPVMQRLIKPDKGKAPRPDGGSGASNSKGGVKELLIGLTSDKQLTKQELGSLLRDRGIEIDVLAVQQFAPGEFKLSVETALPATDAAKEIKKLPGVDYAEPNVRQKPQPK